MASLPAPIRATLGLLATALDAVQELKEHAPEIPMEAVGNSMQLSMRLQQQYVALLTRGDEFLAGLRGAPEEPPAWATFDESPPAGPDADLSGEVDLGDGGADSPGDADLSSDALADLPEAEIPDGPRHAGQGDPLLAAATKARTAAASGKQSGRKAAADKATPAKAPANVAAAKTATPAKAPAKKAAAKKVAAKTAAKKTAAKKSPAKKAGGVKAESARTPALTATSARKIAKSAAASAAALNPGDPILTPTADPIVASARALGKNGRLARKTSSRKATAVPQLDAGLTVGQVGARPQSAFDLADTSNEPSAADAGLDALLATAATDVSANGHGPTDTDTDTDEGASRPALGTP